MKRKIKVNELKVVYKQTEGLSEEEVQRKLDKAFGILFSEVDKEQKRRSLLLATLPEKSDSSNDGK